MLPSNYDSLVAKYPWSREALDGIAGWVRSHADWNLIDPRVLSKDLRHLDPLVLAAALELLIDSGLLRQVYMVATPDTGVLAEGVFDDVEKIPDRLNDRFERPFDTSEADIVAVLTAP